MKIGSFVEKEYGYFLPNEFDNMRKMVCDENHFAEDHLYGSEVVSGITNLSFTAYLRLSYSGKPIQLSDGKRKVIPSYHRISIDKRVDKNGVIQFSGRMTLYGHTHYKYSRRGFEWGEIAHDYNYDTDLCTLIKELIETYKKHRVIYFKG